MHWNKSNRTHISNNDRFPDPRVAMRSPALDDLVRMGPEVWTKRWSLW